MLAAIIETGMVIELFRSCILEAFSITRAINRHYFNRQLNERVASFPNVCVYEEMNTSVICHQALI